MSPYAVILSGAKDLFHFAQGKLREWVVTERRLRSCDPEVATVNSSWELTAGSSSKQKPTVTKAVTVATSCPIPFKALPDHIPGCYTSESDDTPSAISTGVVISRK